MSVSEHHDFGLGRPLSFHHNNQTQIATSSTTTPAMNSKPELSQPISPLPNSHTENSPVSADAQEGEVDNYTKPPSSVPLSPSRANTNQPPSFMPVETSPQAYPQSVHPYGNDHTPGKEIRPSESSSSGVTRREDDYGPQNSTEVDAEHEEALRELEKRHFRRAGWINTLYPEAGTAAMSTLLATAGDKRDVRQVQVVDKYGVWSPQLKKERRSAMKRGAIVFGGITLWLWCWLPFFWGSTYKLLDFLPRFTVEYVSFDNSADAYLNGPISQMVATQQSLPVKAVHLGWVERSASDFPNGLSDVYDHIIGQKSWAVVVVNENATSSWQSALENGDSSYDPNYAVGVYYASARWYQLVLLYFEALIANNLAEPIATAQTNAFKSFVSSATGNAGLLSSAANVPQAIGTPFGYTIHDIRYIPNGEWAAAAPMEAALIYFVIFAFYIAMYGAFARMRSGLNEKLKFRSLLGLRLGWTLIAYFFMSLWQTLVVRAFQVRLDRYLGSAGFVTLWALNYVTLIAGGWGMETALSIVGPSFLPLFLIMWLIINITSSFFPIQIMPIFYRWLYWAPFLHNVEGFKIIAFGTNYLSELGYHFGILFAVIGVELIGLPLSIFYERWALDRNKRKAAMSKQEEEKQAA